MKTAVKLLGALAIIAGMGMVADGLYAACNGEGHLGYPIFQCGERAYFAPPPPTAGAVSGAFWQIGFGNRNISNGGGPTGTGFVSGAGFIGNDSGQLILGYGGLDLESGTVIGGPPGSLCFASAGNWINPGTDGCADDARDGA